MRARKTAAPRPPVIACRLLTPIVVLAIAIVAFGCVSSGDYNAVVSERDGLSAKQKRLIEKIRLLETSNKALADELDTTLDQYEDLNIERDTLVTTVSNLETKEVELSTALTATSTELERATQEVALLSETYTELMADLEAEVSSGQIEITQLREGIQVNVSDEILFASGSAKLDPIGREVLEKVTEQLKGLEHSIEVQGHTDDRGIRGSLKNRYPTNWELAAARASRVVRLMQERGIEGERLRVVSLASYQPIASNDTPEDRMLNRRIEIRLEPRQRRPEPKRAASEPEQADDGA